MHNLVICNKEKDKKIVLDDFVLKGVKGFSVKSSADGTTELELKLIIKDFEIEI